MPAHHCLQPSCYCWYTAASNCTSRTPFGLLVYKLPASHLLSCAHSCQQGGPAAALAYSLDCARSAGTDTLVLPRLLQCIAPTNCTTPMDNKCDGCSVCLSGFAPAPSTRQCLACTGGQAPGVCTAYNSTGTSCTCTACAAGWRLDKGTCVRCPSNPNCDSYKPNTCECTACKPGFRGPTCAAVGITNAVGIG